ncbi:MAG: NAD(P)H-dependent oxidoreductase subunit E [Bacteroidales bacterium]|nr:NAD(P)H-dependent oxidoreductase subunit E [Bacteroidales bacterium]
MYLSEVSTELESIVDASIKKHNKFLIAVLQDIQRHYNYLPEDAIKLVADKLEMPLRDIYGVASFYKAFSFNKKGKHIITACLGTACHVRGGPKIVDAITKELNIKPGETTKDMQFSLETAACLGCCAIGPIVVVDGVYFSNVKPTMVKKIIEQTKSGIEKTDIEKYKHIFPVKVSCPRCNHSLMNTEHLIDNYPCIHITVSFGRKHGWLRLSSLYGSYSIESEHEIPMDTELNCFCPHCHTELTSSFECPICGANMVPLMIRGGGTVHFCPRRGCKGHMLDV